MTTQLSSMLLVERFQQAMNRHDLDAFVACFADDYQSDQPGNSQPAFVGSDQVRANWQRMFEIVPDLEGDLLRSAVNGDTVWTEWDWHGTWRDGSDFHVVVLMIFGVCAHQFVWGRVYMEPLIVPSRSTD